MHRVAATSSWSPPWWVVLLMYCCVLAGTCMPAVASCPTCLVACIIHCSGLSGCSTGQNQVGMLGLYTALILCDAVCSTGTTSKFRDCANPCCSIKNMLHVFQSRPCPLERTALGVTCPQTVNSLACKIRVGLHAQTK